MSKGLHVGMPTTKRALRLAVKIHRQAIASMNKMPECCAHCEDDGVEWAIHWLHTSIAMQPLLKCYLRRYGKRRFLKLIFKAGWRSTYRFSLLRANLLGVKDDVGRAPMPVATHGVTLH